MKTMVSGANGFIGKPLCTELTRRGNRVSAAVRSKELVVENAEMFSVGAINEVTDWGNALLGVNCVIHLAARLCVKKNSCTELLLELREVNVKGTLTLARQAAEMGVLRFIFISSIKVNGEITKIGMPFCEDNVPAPQDFYSKSKLDAELGLMEIAANTGMEVVIIRPPLVYGPGAKANFLYMMQWLYRGFPLPFGAIHNKRSLIALDNLIDLVITCLSHPAAANQVFLAGDGEDISTTELLKRMGQALDRPARLIPVSTLLLEAGAALLGRRDLVQRLFCSLQVDISKARMLLGWNPPISVDEGIRRAVGGFLREKTF